MTQEQCPEFYIEFLKETRDLLIKENEMLRKDLAQLQCDLITERLKSDRLEKEDEKLRKLAYGGDP